MKDSSFGGGPGHLEHAATQTFSTLPMARLQSILDGLIDAAVIVDPEFRPLAWNTPYMQAVGLRPRTFAKTVREKHKHCCDLLHLEICENQCLAKQCFEGNRSLRLDEIKGASRLISEPLETTWIVSAIPLHGEKDRVAAVLEIYRDVTAEARIQTRYKALLEQERRRAEILEELVKERTADLEASLEELRNTRAQLVQSEKLSSLGQLIAGIAHEINNPINFIYGNTDFLQNYVETFLRLIHAYEEISIAEADQSRIASLKQEVEYDYVQEDVGKLIRSLRSGAERAAAIIRDLRSFIHGRPNERSKVDLVRCVNQTLNLLTHETKNRIEIRREGSEHVSPVLCNEGQLNQVFMNLLVNAVQAIEKEGMITLRFTEKEGGVAVDVEDNGVGISEENLLKVFDPFFTTKPVGKGTGLGLSLSYSIVDAHGGKITAQSQPGKGSTFTVWLPLQEALAQTEDTHERPVKSP